MMGRVDGDVLRSTFSVSAVTLMPVATDEHLGQDWYLRRTNL